MHMVNMRKYELIDRMNIKLRIKRKAQLMYKTGLRPI